MTDNVTDTIMNTIDNADNPPLKVLYICTHNRCRSALSEAITNQIGNQVDNHIGSRSNKQSGHVKVVSNESSSSPVLIAKSAGSAPAGEVHPLTLKYLTAAGFSTEGLSSNSWEDTEYMDGFEPDVLITVCDNAAGESCPIWLGNLPNLTKLHWGLADPSKNTADEAQTEQSFTRAIALIEERVAQLVQIAQMPVTKRRQALLYLKD